MRLTYTLVCECLKNVDDVAGRWQIEGGQVLDGKRKVANYSSVERVGCGTDPGVPLVSDPNAPADGR